jgi:hypothetical protein
MSVRTVRLDAEAEKAFAYIVRTNSVFQSLEDVVPLSTVGCQLALQDVYAKVDLQQASDAV